jgi:hypothetical protein
MDTRIDYNGFVIETNPQESADGSGWLESCVIRINRFEGSWYGSDRKFPTKEAANAASILAAKRIIDRSRSKSGQDVDWKDAAPPNDPSATWIEDEEVHRIVQGDVDPLTGDGHLGWTKNKRRQRLDELDEEPE